MSPSHARKGGVKYRYYLSAALLRGTAACAGSVRRVPAADIETLVVKAVREHLKLTSPIDDRSLIDIHVARVEVQSEQLVLQLRQTQKPNRQKANGDNILNVPWHKTPSTRQRELLLPAGMPRQHARPIRSSPAHSWWHPSREAAAGSPNFWPRESQMLRASRSASGVVCAKST